MSAEHLINELKFFSEFLATEETREKLQTVH